MFLKYFRQSDDDQIFHLSTIPVLVNGVCKQVPEKEAGNVVYVDVYFLSFECNELDGK